MAGWIELTPAFIGAGMLSGLNASWSFFGGAMQGISKSTRIRWFVCGSPPTTPSSKRCKWLYILLFPLKLETLQLDCRIGGPYEPSALLASSAPQATLVRHPAASCGE
ncbi:hypothetical protein JOM56_000235 [Amanita muscaria]